MDIQFVREILSNDKNIFNYIENNYITDYIVKYSNFGFIVILKNENFVHKYYIPDNYYVDLGIKIDGNYFNKKKNNYFLFNNNGILTPKYLGNGEVKIGKYKFKYAKLENIRLINDKIKNFNEIDTKKLSQLLIKVHSIKKGYAHLNIHVSNFFISNNGEIGIFDLVDYSKGHKELDLAKICLGYNFNFSLSIKFLYLYGFDNINFKLLLTGLKDSYKNNNITKESAKNLYILLSYIKK